MCLQTISVIVGLRNVCVHVDVISIRVQHAQYADDSQLYIKLQGTVSLLVMENCFTAIHNWFTANGLSINPDKSEIIVVGTASRQRHEGDTGSLSLGDAVVPVSRSVRSLGVTLDSTMSFDKHTDSVCRSSFHHIRALRRIRKLISPANMMAVATTVVSSRLDYCNSLLYGTTASNVRKLQRVQNDMARLVTCSSSSRGVIPLRSSPIFT